MRADTIRLTHQQLPSSREVVSLTRHKDPTMTSIPDFYAGRSIFITGATGFMGKVLLEKLLRSCPIIKDVYLLVRHKKGVAPEKRLDQLLKCKLFDKLRSDRPDFQHKVHAMSGDICEQGLGLSKQDTITLIENVSIVFHSAATVKFDEQLKLSLQMNVGGVKELLQLSHKMSNLEAFVHVSSAYANCDRTEIMECVYTPKLHPNNLLDAVGWMSDSMIDTLTSQLVSPHPNTYTYTKAMGEYLLVEECGDLPVAIIRPSIVGASWNEPFPGWVDNFNGPTGLLVAIGKGILRIMHGSFHGTADIIPVDIATNLMIAVAWATAIERPETVKVFNCTTGQLNKITWGQMERASYKYFMKNPLNDVVRIPNPRFTTSWMWRHLNVWMDHILPAWMMDTYLQLIGRRPVMTRLQQRLWKSVQCLEYFTSKEWHFKNDNILELLGKLHQTDLVEFNFDVREVDWEKYMENYCMGTKQFALKEDVSQMSKARKAIIVLQRRHKVIKAVFVLVVFRFLVTRVSTLRGLWQFLLTWAVRLLNALPGISNS